MAGQRRLRLLIPLIAGSVFTTGSFAPAQQPGGGTPDGFTPGPGGRPGHRQGGGGGGNDAAGAPEFENARKAIEALTPEQRKRFQENFLRWMSLTPEEKQTLRERDGWRKEVMAQEVEHAIKQSGLTLDAAQRDQFGRRYAEERRAIEMQLRKDMEEKRRPLVQALIARLRQEFSTGSAPAAAGTPVAAP